MSSEIFKLSSVGSVIESELKKKYPEYSIFQLRIASYIFLKDDFTPDLTQKFKDHHFNDFCDKLDTLLQEQSYYLAEPTKILKITLRIEVSLIDNVYTFKAKENVLNALLTLINDQWINNYCDNRGYPKNILKIIKSSQFEVKWIFIEVSYDREEAINCFSREGGSNFLMNKD